MNIKDNLLALGGAVAGGVVGYFGVFWIAHQGFYCLVLPGGLIGLGAGISKKHSNVIAVVCGFFGLALSVFTDWRFEPFVADDSLAYYLSHLHQLRPVTMIMIVFGTALAGWIPYHHQPAAS